MVSRRFACLLLAASMTLSSIWIVSADQSHQIQDAAAAAATYSAAVQVLEGAGLSQSAEANAGIAIDMGLLDREETLDLSQLSVQAVQLQQEEKARQEEAARQAALDAAHRTGRQAARQALLDAYDGAMATRQITVYDAPSDSAASLRTLRQGKVARLNDVTEDGGWYQITFSGTTGYVRSDACQAVQYSDYAGTSAVKSAREDLVDYAKSFLGTRYVWGGASPSGFDCSGFTMYVYAHFGYRMSHGAITAAPMWVRCGSWPTDNDLLSHPPFASPRSGPTLRGELFFLPGFTESVCRIFAFVHDSKTKTLILAMKG